MNFDVFSNNENYIMENIPSNINYFNKKKWIKEKIAEMGHAKSLVFADKEHILCAFLNENEQYWLPAEKVKFYLYVFQVNYPYIIIAERENEKINYYGILNNFLIIFTKDWDEVMDTMLAYSKARQIRVLGVGDIKLECYKKMNFNQINRAIFENENNVYSNNIDDDLIYLNEENFNDLDMIKEDDSKKFQEAFLYWFNNLKDSQRPKRLYFLTSLIFGILFFSVAGIYCTNSTIYLKKEIDLTMHKIDKIKMENKNKRE